MLGIEELSAHDRAIVARARRLERFLTQPFATMRASDEKSGSRVSLKDTLDGCETLLSQTTFPLPESVYYMVGTLVEAEARAR